MKKKIGSLVLALILVVSVCGCGSKEEPAPAATVESQSKQETTAATTEASQEPVAAAELTDEEIYEAFRAGTVKVKFSEDNYWAKQGEYSLGELVDLYCDYAKEDYMPCMLTDSEYAIIDALMDGRKELAVRLNLADESGYDGSEATFVFCIQDGEVQFITDFLSYYRSSTSINSAGVISGGGSMGATSYGYDCYVISAENKLEFIYCCEDECIGTDGVIDPSQIPGIDGVPEWYEFYWEDIGDAYLDAYTFNLYDSEMDYTEYCRNKLYVMTGENGDDITADQEYMDYYAKCGMVFVSSDVIKEKISEKYKSFGYTDEMIREGEPDWIKMTIQLPSRLAVQEKRSDISTPEGQIQTILNNRSMWYVTRGDDYTWIVGFAVCDMNHNGRLELVSTEYNYDSGANINRFYEISEDYTSLNKLEYDCETMWYDGEENGWCPAIYNNSGNMYCIIEENGKGSADYKGPTYRYIVPTGRGDGDDFVLNKIEMSINQDGYIWTGSLGLKESRSWGWEYSDPAGLAIGETAFENMEFLYYSEEEYQVVSFDFISIEPSVQDENLYWNLHNSYKGFSFESYVPDMEGVTWE